MGRLNYGDSVYDSKDLNLIDKENKLRIDELEDQLFEDAKSEIGKVTCKHSIYYYRWISNGQNRFDKALNAAFNYDTWPVYVTMTGQYEKLYGSVKKNEYSYTSGYHGTIYSNGDVSVHEDRESGAYYTVEVTGHEYVNHSVKIGYVFYDESYDINQKVNEINESLQFYKKEKSNVKNKRAWVPVRTLEYLFVLFAFVYLFLCSSLVGSVALHSFPITEGGFKEIFVYYSKDFFRIFGIFSFLWSIEKVWFIPLAVCLGLGLALFIGRFALLRAYPDFDRTDGKYIMVTPFVSVLTIFALQAFVFVKIYYFGIDENLLLWYALLFIIALIFIIAHLVAIFKHGSDIAFDISNFSRHMQSYKKSGGSISFESLLEELKKHVYFPDNFRNK